MIPNAHSSLCIILDKTVECLVCGKLFPRGELDLARHSVAVTLQHKISKTKKVVRNYVSLVLLQINSALLRLKKCFGASSVLLCCWECLEGCCSPSICFASVMKLKCDAMYYVVLHYAVLLYSALLCALISKARSFVQLNSISHWTVLSLII